MGSVLQLSYCIVRADYSNLKESAKHLSVGKENIGELRIATCYFLNAGEVIMAASIRYKLVTQRNTSLSLKSQGHNALPHKPLIRLRQENLLSALKQRPRCQDDRGTQSGTR